MEKIIYILLLSSLIHLHFQRSICGPERERTLAMVKPDGVMANHSEEIKRVISAKGFVITAQKHVQMDESAVKTFYAEHSQRAFFPSLVKFMTSGPVLPMVLEKEDAVAEWRALIGPTDARKARISHPHCIRALCGLDSEKNCVHGSDSHQSAAREIAFFFGDYTSGEAISGHDEL
uniref:Nucleoside diphosphate kinase, mitochondrial n=1 Tax=Araucaria cunninghamii TaxID=56994 RepID=A0A0D6R5A5_ARACU